ncbi:hypothetical protein HXX76_008593 [Chlamydomonas incerta]|uniref:Uncharacterized protein n=1 Tax=Chlamydomonas incerta TaxID=51695 RepID=A0A835T782_CHLIN|nr:hypothetical protein HXX76_008593 [Chlamydomonas incerta]|eukprot:KAG2432861.1 hypothetical protein HXX76_008593 [Chlamydomonas incerta]
MSELAGLSVEEAALINDVLTRLSIGQNAQAVPGLQAPNVLHHAADPELAELELAEQAIEQELRGLDNGTPPSSVRASLAAPPTYPYGGVQQAPAGAFAGVGAHRSTLPYSSPRDSLAAGGTIGGGVAAPGPNAASRAQPGEFLQPPDYGSASYGSVGIASSRQAVVRATAGMPVATYGAALAPQLATSAASAAAVGAGPMPAAQSMSLQEMREQLRRQQQQQQQQQQVQQQQSGVQQQVAFAGSAGVGEPAPVTRGEIPELAGAGAGAGAEADAGQADGDMPSPRGPTQASSGGPGGAMGGQAVSGAAAATPAASTASMAMGGARRVPMPSPAEAARAFTMLNARTSVDKYGHQADISAPFSSSKVPVKLPEQERVTRLQQLYERTSQWRRRCEERHAKIKHDLESSALEECTFSPQICNASNLIMQGKPPAEVYHELSKWATPTKHQQKPMSAYDRPYMGAAPPAASSAYTTPARGAPPAKGRNASANNTPAAFRQFRTTGSSGGGAAAQDSARGGGAGASSSSPTPSKVVVNGPEVGTRMYNRATEQRLRQEERVLRQMLEEEQQRRFTASLQGVKPRVYNQPEPSSSRFLPTGMEECTFHPNSSAGQSTSRPKSAPHARPGTSSSGQRAASPGRSDAVSTSRSQAFSNMSTMGGSVHSTVSVRPELDWGEFLARQERFLADREHKLALLEQEDPLMPHMSPGSRRLLKEKEVRDSVPRTDGPEEGGAAQPSASTSGSPGRLERKLRTIMEMYRECTFQPQITRKAAAMPHRSVDEMMDGGRSRRDEWLEQQRAVQQMRELEGVTFKPQTNTKDNYSHVRPRINMRNPDAYLAQVDMKRRQREALRNELEREREALELQHCTFKPQVTPLPPYLIRRLQEQQLQQLQQLQEMQEMQELAMMEMQEQADEASWGQAGVAGGYAADGGGMQHPEAAAVEEAEGVSAEGGYSQAAAGYDPYLYGDLPAAREPAYASTGEDPGISELDPEYQAAYQRALAFAMNQGQ